MKLLLGLTVFFIAVMCLFKECDLKDPYSVGAHWDYSISCQDGFMYKSLAGRGTILILNSDGSPLKCGQKHY